ncbi:phosphate/phosphite/phosphonate ABC transporter substrate-binding protein [Arenibacterium sp. CAU 1754]
MIAALGMYDMPAIQGANDRFWQAIQARLGYGPARLTRAGDFWEIWTSRDLILAQTCGLPYRSRLHDQVTLVGTPDYALPGCPPGYYNSVLVVRNEADGDTPGAFAGGTLAYNEKMSQSGWAAPTAHLSALGIGFEHHLESGAHAESARAVAQGRADMAGIDALTWRLLCAHDPVAGRLRVIDVTAPTPGLPLITAVQNDPAPIAGAVRAAIGDLDRADRDALYLNGLIDIPAADYLALSKTPTA